MNNAVHALSKTFQTIICGIVERCTNVDVRAYEVAAPERIAAELCPLACSICDEARRVMGDVLAACEPATEQELAHAHDDGAEALRKSYLPFERSIDAMVATKLGSYTAVSEIAFIAQLELRQRSERLERTKPAHGVAAVLGECDSTLRRVRKGLTAVDASIAKVEGVPPMLGFASELQTSLAVRRAYAKFRTRVTTGSETGSLRARFRAVGTQIAMLVGWDAYPDMRVRDRLLLRDLQQRVLGWLREGDSADAEAGLRIWQDLTACVEMFPLVNRRQELLEHDSAAVCEAMKALAGQPPAEIAEATTWRTLRTLEGLDEELDRILAGPPPVPATLLPVLTRLAIQLGAAAMPPVSSHPLSEEVPW